MAPTAVVTGARGFLGGHLVAALRGGWDVVETHGDVRAPETYARLPRGAPVVFHLAAQSSVPESVRAPEETWRVNVDGTLRLLEWARRADVGRVVLVSTAHVYGRVKRSPVDEDAPLAPVSPYGASKLAAEAALRAYVATYGLGGTIVRPFNVYGPRQAPGFLVPDVLLPLAEGRAPKLGDPRPVRDFTFVDDAVDLIVRAGTTPGVAGADAFNLGSGEGVSVRDLAKLAADVSGTGLAPTFDEERPPRAGDVPELVVDNARARSRLGWAPRVPLRAGLERTWRAIGAAGARRA